MGMGLNTVGSNLTVVGRPWNRPALCAGQKDRDGWTPAQKEVTHRVGGWDVPFLFWL